MPTFTITAANSSINIDPMGHGVAAFTVSNVSKRAMRVRARVKPLANAQESWFSLDGDTERDFPVDGTQQFTVNVSVPAGTPPAQASFRLDTADSAHPEERYDQGPTVGFEIKPPPPEPKKFPWWIVAVAAAVCIIGALAAVLLLHKSTPNLTMPKVVGQSIEEARKTLTNAGITNEVKLSVEDLAYGKFIVVKSSPAEGQPVEAKTPIVLTLHVPRVQVPGMQGAKVAQAVKQLNGIGLIPNKGNAPDDATLTSTTPSEGKIITIGSTVYLHCDTPPPPPPPAPSPIMPNLVGEHVEAVQGFLRRAGIHNEWSPRMESAPPNKPGIVFKQDPPPGVPVSSTYRITVKVGQ